jgi:TRAP-type C4-dicarboxylate transport system substrate-binding protein
MIYAGGTLGPNQMLVESMISGTVDMAIVTNPDVSNYARDLRVLDLPFQFLDWDEVYRFLHSDIIKEFYKVSEVMSISTLAFMPRGFHHVTNNKGPITKPSDFLNMKIRIVGNETYMDTFTALGADPLSMPWDETYTALRDGRMEGNENTIITLNDYRIYEVQKYLSKTEHFFAFATVIASPIMFNSIMSDDQELIRKAAFDAALDLGDEQLAAENGAAANLEKNGIMINEIGDKQPFIDLMEPVYEKFFRNHNRRYYDLIKSAIK